MKNLTKRQFEVMCLLDRDEWRVLDRPNAIVAGTLCKPFRPSGPRFVEAQTDLARTTTARVYRLTKDGAFRLKFEKDRQL
jgi:hypothetical protein